MDLSKSYDYFQPEKMGNTPIHIIGCGSVGATVAENLTRCGVKNLHLWDFDIVESHNIANQIFRLADVGTAKTEALLGILTEINPELKDTVVLHNEGWQGETLTGFVFLCADSMKVRQAVVDKHMASIFVKAMFDFRTELESAQHYAVDWKSIKARQNFRKSMDFTDEEAKAATPVSACGTTLSVCPTIRTICAFGVSNFMNFWNGKPLKTLILVDAFNFNIQAY